MNRIRDLIRQHKRRPEISGFSEDLEDEATSPLEAADRRRESRTLRSRAAAAEAADREAIIGRLEMLYSATTNWRPSSRGPPLRRRAWR